MFLQHRPNRSLVEVLNFTELWDPFIPALLGRYHAGEEMQDPELFSKVDLIFPSGERLPQCWVDPHYREREILASDFDAVPTL
jgi:hypothetical protein